MSLAQFTPTRLMVAARSLKKVTRKLREAITHLRSGRISDARSALVHVVYQLDEEIERLG